MESLVVFFQGLPYFAEVSTVVTIASVSTMTLKDKIGNKIPLLNKIWPILNWMSLNIFHNENKSDGKGK